MLEWRIGGRIRSASTRELLRILTTHDILAGLRRRAPRRPVRLGSLGRPRPISEQWGYDRGTPVDRWYIERFLQEHRADITGRVLEVKDSGYTDRFGLGV